MDNKFNASSLLSSFLIKKLQNYLYLLINLCLQWCICNFSCIKESPVGAKTALNQLKRNSYINRFFLSCSFSQNIFSTRFCVCVYKRNIFCLLRLCLLLCGVGCFIPSEDSRPALLTGTSDLSKKGHLAVTRSQCCRRHTLTYHFLSTTNLVFSYEAIPLKMLNVYFKFDKEICHFCDFETTLYSE